MIMLKRSKNLLTKSALLPIYYGHIHSHLKYGILLWGSMLTQGQMKRLQKLQNEVIQLIDQKSTLQMVYLEQKISNLEKLIRLEQQKLGYCLVNNLLPKNLEKQITTDHKGSHLVKNHQYNTRFKTEPNHPSTKSSNYHTSFLHQCIKAFSTLPYHVKQKPNLRLFIKTIKPLN